MNLKPAFSRFLGSDPERLHFAAHSHHPWPDVSFEAHQRAWHHAAETMDDKWGMIFDELIPRLANRIAALIGVDSGDTITFGPNTHSFLNRIFSCLEPPVRVLTTASEFHSFTRQSRRWEEAGLAIVERVPTEPYESFAERFAAEARSGAHDLVYLSEVFYDSGACVEKLDRIISTIPENRTFIVIDGYHAFMARPVDIGAIQDRVFYLAGGYKYAMSGEGVCFLHAPAGYGERPVDTGWYAGFGQLETGVSDLVPYADGGARFSGATYDPSGLFRMDAVLAWLDSEGATPSATHEYVTDLQTGYLATAPRLGDLVPTRGHPRGNFLTFDTGDAAHIYRRLHDQKVITDYRGTRLRIGFGIYQDYDDVAKLVERLAALGG